MGGQFGLRNSQAKLQIYDQRNASPSTEMQKTDREISGIYSALCKLFLELSSKPPVLDHEEHQTDHLDVSEGYCVETRKRTTGTLDSS